MSYSGRILIQRGWRQAQTTSSTSTSSTINHNHQYRPHATIHSRSKVEANDVTKENAASSKSSSQQSSSHQSSSSSSSDPPPSSGGGVLRTLTRSAVVLLVAGLALEVAVELHAPTRARVGALGPDVIRFFPYTRIEDTSPPALKQRAEVEARRVADAERERAYQASKVAAALALADAVAAAVRAKADADRMSTDDASAKQLAANVDAQKAKDRARVEAEKDAHAAVVIALAQRDSRARHDAMIIAAVAAAADAELKSSLAKAEANEAAVSNALAKDAADAAAVEAAAHDAFMAEFAKSIAVITPFAVAPPVLPPPPPAELTSILARLSAAESSLPLFIIDQRASFRDDIDELSTGILNRGKRDLESIEADQKCFVHERAFRHNRSADRKAFHALPDILDAYRVHRSIDEENIWRAKLTKLALEQHAAAQQAFQARAKEQEATIRDDFELFISKLSNANDALATGQIAPLRKSIKAAKEYRLKLSRSARFAAGVGSLDRTMRTHDYAPLDDRAKFGKGWALVKEAMRQDVDLAADRKFVDNLARLAPARIDDGVHSIEGLQRTFVEMYPSLKATTFMPDDAAQWSYASELFADAASWLTLDESDGVVLLSRVVDPSVAIVAIDNGWTDFVHVSNARSHIAKGEFALALAELDALQPSRRCTIDRFIDELRATAQMMEAIRQLKIKTIKRNEELARNVA